MFTHLNNAARSVAGRAAVGTALAVAAGSAMATGANYDAITSAVDWGSVSTAIITILAAGAAVVVAMVGGKFLLRAIRAA